MSDVWPTQRVCEVADGIVTVVHGQGEMGVSNASFIIEGKRAFVVDTMTFPEMAQGLLQEIVHRGARVETVLNTHHHLDHMGGNALFTGAHLIAHPQSVLAMQQLGGLPPERYDQLMPKFRGRFNDLRLALPEPQLDLLVPPQGGELRVFSSAHTIADACLWFAKSRVLLAGDLCFVGVTPLAIHGSIAGWLEALDTLIALEPAVVVPGHGPIGTLADLIALRDYFAMIQRLGKQAVEEHMSLDEALTHIDLGPASDWIEAERHSINMERAMLFQTPSRNDIGSPRLPRNKVYTPNPHESN